MIFKNNSIPLKEIDFLEFSDDILVIKQGLLEFLVLRPIVNGRIPLYETVDKTKFFIEVDSIFVELSRNRSEITNYLGIVAPNYAYNTIREPISYTKVLNIFEDINGINSSKQDCILGIKALYIGLNCRNTQYSLIKSFVLKEQFGPLFSPKIGITFFEKNNFQVSLGLTFRSFQQKSGFNKTVIIEQNTVDYQLTDSTKIDGLKVRDLLLEPTLGYKFKKKSTQRIIPFVLGGLTIGVNVEQDINLNVSKLNNRTRILEYSTSTILKEEIEFQSLKFGLLGAAGLEVKINSKLSIDTVVNYQSSNVKFFAPSPITGVFSENIKDLNIDFGLRYGI